MKSSIGSLTATHSIHRQPDLTFKSFAETYVKDHGQLHKRKENWWTAGGSNSRPPRCERGALPTELAAHLKRTVIVTRSFLAPQRDAFTLPATLDPRALAKTTRRAHRRR